MIASGEEVKLDGNFSLSHEWLILVGRTEHDKNFPDPWMTASGEEV